MVDSDLMVVADLTVDIELDDRHKLDCMYKLEKPRLPSCRAHSAAFSATFNSVIELNAINGYFNVKNYC